MREKIWTDRPYAQYFTGDDRVSPLPRGSFIVYTVQKVGSFSLFHSLVDSGILAAKLHWYADLKEKASGNHFVIDVFRDPLAQAISYCFQRMDPNDRPADVDPEDFFDDAKVMMNDLMFNTDDLRRRLMSHFWDRYLFKNKRLEAMWGEHFMPIVPFMSHSWGEPWDLGNGFHYLLLDFDSLDDCESIIRQVPGAERFRYHRDHETKDKPRLGHIYEDFRQFFRPSEGFLRSFYRRFQQWPWFRAKTDEWVDRWKKR